MYGIVYQIQFTPQLTSEVITIRIHDKETFDDDLTDEQIIILNDSHDRVPAGNLQIRTIDDSEDKFTSVKGSQAVFSFFSSTAYDFTTFLEGDDDRWVVKIWKDTLIDANLIWQGFLRVDGMSESFKAKPNVVELFATDGLDLIGDKELTDSDDENPRDEHKIIQYIAWALSKTGNELEIWALDNLTEENNTEFPWLETCGVSAKTFEKEIGESEDALTVLQKILGEGRFLFQWCGKHLIVNVDELDNNQYFIHKWDSEGTYIEKVEMDAADLIQLVGDHGGSSAIHIVNENGVQYAQLKHKKVEIIYNYEPPLEIIDNINFDRGTTPNNIVPAPDMGLYVKDFANLGAFPTEGHGEYTYRANDTMQYYRWVGGSYVAITPAEIHIGQNYILEDWTLERASGFPQITASVVKITLLDGQVANYVALSAGQTQDHWIKSNPIYLHLSDMFAFSVDRRLATNHVGNGIATEFFAQIRLFGDNGTFWTLDSDNNGTWVECDSAFTQNQNYITVQYDMDDTDESEWKTASVTARPLPASGELRILLRASALNGNIYQTHFSNLSFTYYPYINGTYQTYTGHQHTVSQDGTTKAKRESTVYLGNSPKKLFKGALKRYNGSDWVLVDGFYKGNQFPLGNYDEVQSFGWHQVFSVWNQFRRSFRILDLDMFNLRTDEDVSFIPDLLNIYGLTVTNPAAFGKYYMLLHKVQDYDNNILTGRLIEIWDSTALKVYDDDYEFKYISGQ